MEHQPDRQADLADEQPEGSADECTARVHREEVAPERGREELANGGHEREHRVSNRRDAVRLDDRLGGGERVRRGVRAEAQQQHDGHEPPCATLVRGAVAALQVLQQHEAAAPCLHG